MKKILVFLVFFNWGCSHKSQLEFQSDLRGQRCEDAMLSVPEMRSVEQVKNSATWVASNTVAYTFVGMNYTAEVLWDVGMGTVAIVALCWPQLFVTSNSESRGRAACLPAPVPFKAVSSPPLGRAAIKNTQDLRCPNVEPLAQSLEKVALCFESRDTVADRKLAHRTLSNIENSKHFFSCVSPEVQDRISKKRASLESALSY